MICKMYYLYNIFIYYLNEILIYYKDNTFYYPYEFSSL